MTKQLSKLGAALDRQSWQWLQDAAPDIAEALEAEVMAGADPEMVRRYIVNYAGDNRTGLADRCQSAARYLTSQQAR